MTRNSREMDFKGVLDDFTECLMAFGDNGMARESMNAVIVALKLADRVQSGEASDEMCDIIWDHLGDTKGTYKLVTDQLMKEVDDASC